MTRSEEDNLRCVENIREQLSCGFRPANPEQRSAVDPAPERVNFSEGPWTPKVVRLTGFVPKRGKDDPDSEGECSIGPSRGLQHALARLAAYSELWTGQGSSAESVRSRRQATRNAIEPGAGTSQNGRGSPVGSGQWLEAQPKQRPTLARASGSRAVAKHEPLHKLRHAGLTLLGVVAASVGTAHGEINGSALHCTIGSQAARVILRPHTLVLELTRELEGAAKEAAVSDNTLLAPANDACGCPTAGLVQRSPVSMSPASKETNDLKENPQQLSSVLETVVDSIPAYWLQEHTSNRKALSHQSDGWRVDGAVAAASPAFSDDRHPQRSWAGRLSLSERIGGEVLSPTPQHSRHAEAVALGAEEHFRRAPHSVVGRAQQGVGSAVPVAKATTLSESPLTRPLKAEAPAEERLVQEVFLGTSGSIVLERQGDEWTTDERPISDGDLITAANGSSYTLRYRNGHWSAEFVPEVRPIAGTPLSATWREDRSGYRVGTAALLPKSGHGDVVADDKRYHVWEESGSLRGQRFDLPPHSTEASEGYYSPYLQKRGPTLSVDDKETVANERGTRIEVGGGSFPIGSLLGQKWASSGGERIVDGVRAEIAEMKNTADALFRALGDDQDSQALLTTEVRLLWREVVSKIGQIFDGEVKKWGTLSLSSDLIDRREHVIERFDTVLEALSSLKAFQAATKTRGGGVFARAKKSEVAARNLFNSQLSRSRAVFGLTESTRYGAVDTQVREGGNAERAFKRSGPGTASGAFAYSTIPTTGRTSAINISGDAVYRGGTTVTTGKGGLYRGSIEVQVRLDNNSVWGLVTSLQTERGRPWFHRGNRVDAIYLANATLESGAYWRVEQEAEGSAQIVYEDDFERGFSVSTSSFDGSLLGTGEQAGFESVGYWSIGNRRDGSEFLVGTFGAVLVQDRPDTDQTDTETLDDINLAPTAVLPQGSEIKGGILTLRGTLYGPNPETTRTGDDWDDEILLLEGGRKIEDTYELLLEEAFARQGTVRDYLGRDLIRLARHEVHDLRDDLTAVILLGQDAVALRERSKIWSKINERVRSRLFGTADNALPGRDFAGDAAVPRSDPRKWSSGYPTAQDGSPEDLAALEAIDGILAALASPSDLADAVAEGQGGVFTRADGVPFRPLRLGGIDEIWKRAEGRIKMWVQSTDYTRFGAWRKQTAPNAWSEYRDRIENDENGPNAFAYSPLSPSNYDDYRFPVGGTSRYSGMTVAVQGATFYTGAVELIARWHEPQRGQYDAGILSVAISGLETKEGAPLRYAGGTADGSTGDPIGTIYLDGVQVQIASERLLYFADTSPSALSIELDRTSDPSVDLSDALSASASLEGLFVGRTQHGPQGAVGTWTLRSRNSHTIGTGAMVRGGFGVEVVP